MFSRRRCGLCDKAREVLLEAHAKAPFEMEEVFIDGDDDLERDYGIRVPVIEIDGVETFEYQVEPAALREALGR
jgi:hypothetical protein